MDALEQAAKYLAEYQQGHDRWIEKICLSHRVPKPGLLKDLAQTYALVSIADSLHELTVQGLCRSAEAIEANKQTDSLYHAVAELSHQIKRVVESPRPHTG